MVTAVDGVCTHLRKLPLVVVLVVPRDGDGDFERGGEVKSRGCERVDTMAYGVFCGYSGVYLRIWIVCGG